MTFGINRRRFLKAFGIGAASLALLPISANSVKAGNSATCWLSGFDNDRYGEQTLLTQAVTLTVQRLQQQHIWEKTYELASRANLTADVMENSNLTDNSKNRWGLLWHQLYWLSQPNDASSTSPAFPDIRIRAGYEEPEPGYLIWAGRAQTNTVKIVSTKGGVYQSGEFEIEINRYYTLHKDYQSAGMWAGVIAHEMAHNLGHLHDSGYDVKYQINVLGDVVESNGGNAIRATINRARKTVVPLHQCCGVNNPKKQNPAT